MSKPRPLLLAILTMALIAILTVSQAFALLGVLVNQSQSTSVTGRLVWVCTYAVGGQQTQVVLERICPPTMDFR